MTERNIYADNYSCSFSDPSEFLDFLKERQDNSRWMVTPSRSIVFESLEKDTPMGDLYLKLYEHEGRAEIIADTMENTNLLLKVNGETYPVRSCAIKTILERARISGHALNKVSKKVFTRILNYCMDVAAGESLIKVADEKVSAVHGGDPKDYAVLEILPLVQCVRTVLDRDFPGNHFLTANFDHSISRRFGRWTGRPTNCWMPTMLRLRQKASATPIPCALASGSRPPMWGSAEQTSIRSF